MLRIFFDEPDEIDVEEVPEVPTEAEVNKVINESISPTGAFVHFEDSWHEPLIENLTSF